MSPDTPKILVIGASPDAINLNAHSRSYLARAFEDVLSPDRVKTVPFEYGAEAIASFAPHLVLVFGSCYPDSCDYTAIRRASTSVNAHLAFWLHDDPYEFDYNFRATDTADTIFSNDRFAVQHYRFDRIFHLPLAACPHMHYRNQAKYNQKKFDLLFVGAAFNNRIRLLSDIASCLQGRRLCVRGSGWPEGLAGFQNELVPNEAIADLYARSLAVLNVGRDFDLGNDRYRLPATTPGPRTFEAAMAGCVQLYFATGLEIEDYFEPDKEILLFDSADEVPGLIEDLIQNPKRARTIAKAAQDRAFRDHSFQNRTKIILAMCLPNFHLEEAQPTGKSALA